MAAAAASSLDELAEDLERIGVASSTEEDSSLDETDIDMLVDADLDKVLLHTVLGVYMLYFFAVLWIQIRRIVCFWASRIRIR